MEGDAGASQLNPTDAQDTHDESVAEPEHENQESVDQTPRDEPVAAARRPPRLGRGWAIGICAALLVVTAAAVTGGVLALREQHRIQETARGDQAALQAAKDCVAATQAPDTAAMTAAQAKIIDCSTGNFGVQAGLYSGVMVDAYKAANVQVAVSDMRAAVEKHNDDGSVDVLVAMRVKVTNSEATDQEQGYRLRVQMAPDNGTYKIADLEQVAS